MDFSTRHCARLALSTRPRHLGRLLALVLVALLPALAKGGEFRVEEAATRVVDNVVMMSAQVAYQLNDDVLEALDNGVPLFFILSMNVSRERKWWWDSNVATLEQRYLLLFHALSEKYVIHNLNSGAQGNFTTLSAALDALGRIEDLPVIDANLLEPGKRYWVRLKAALDIEALPAPIRPLAYLSPNWRLESKWHEWSLDP